MLTDDLATRIERLKVADLADACRDVGFVPGMSAPDLRPARPYSRLCGTAVTVRAFLGRGSVDYGDQMAEVYLRGRSAMRAILVCQNDVPSFAWMGSGGARVARAHGYAGCVVGGPIRDTEELRDEPLPVFGTAVVAGGIRVSDAPAGLSIQFAMDQPVLIAGMLVRPGDVVVGDNDGAIAIPADRIDAVVRAAEDILTYEDRVYQALDGGLTFREFLDREQQA